MMETIEDWSSDDPEGWCRGRDWGKHRRHGNPRSKSLMGSFLIEVVRVLFHHLDTLLFIEEEERVEAFPTDGANEPFASRIRFGRANRGAAESIRDLDEIARPDGLASRVLRLGTPETFEQVMMPAQQCLRLNEQDDFFPSAQQTGDGMDRQSIQSHKLGTFDLPVVVSVNPSRLSECPLPLDKHLR